MKKRVLSLILVIVFTFLCFPICVSAQTVTGLCGADGDNLTWIFDTDTKTLTISGTGDMKSYNKGGFVPLERPWEDYIKDIESVVIEEGVTSLGTKAFDKATSVTRFTFSGSVQYFNRDVFNHLSSLQTINVATDSEYYKSVDGVLFDKDMNVIVKYPAGKTAASYTVPDGILYIDSYAFYDCEALTDVKIPESVRDIGSYTFAECINLKNIKLPKGITSINECTFAFCSSLQSIVFPDDLTQIHYRAFYDCESLENVDIPDGVDYIAQAAFAFCTAFTDITVPEKITYLFDSVFHGCKNLKTITLSDKIEQVGECAFSGCTSLETVNYAGTKEQRNQMRINYFENDYFKNANWVYEYKPFVLGDVNGNGRVSVLDTMMLRKYIAEAISEDRINLSAADMDDDGIITSADVACIKKALTGIK